MYNIECYEFNKDGVNMDDMKDWLSTLNDLNSHIDDFDVKEKPARKLDLFNDILPALDNRNKEYYGKLMEEQKKEAGMWLLMRWMSSAKSNPEHHIMMVNDLVNHNFNNLQKHPELQWKLLAICGAGKRQLHLWIHPPKGLKKNKLEELILKDNPSMSDFELEIYRAINSENDFIEYLASKGLDDKAIIDILK